MIKRDEVWQILKSKLSYQSQWFKVRDYQLIASNGQIKKYGVLEKRPTVFIVPQDDDGSLYFIKEYRFPLRKEILQLPAGMVESERSLLEEAQRELKEETGIQAGKWQKLGSFFVAPGHETTKIFVFLARDLNLKRLKKRVLKEGIFNIQKFSLIEVERMIGENKIKCGITLAALSLFLRKATKLPLD